ncbi:MAG: phenylalanine--tRNA ligase subunit alpha [bacterium]
MVDRIERLGRLFRQEIAKIDTPEELEKLRIKYLGRKGLFTEIFEVIRSLPPEERPKAGQLANQVRNEAFAEWSKKEKEIELRREEVEEEKKVIDVTLPGKKFSLGRKHPITLTLDEIKNIFVSLGFRIVGGPEVETEYYNFEALNMNLDHPARDMWSTLYIGEGVLLRTHTSPVQIRVMERQSPPLAIIAPGKCYRRDAIDASHSPMFHQVEGLLVDEEVSFANLKGVLTHFLHRMFSPETKVRFRPSFFPFTEPSVEVDIQCVICGGTGCSVCKQSGWLEILGAGMVNPKVFEFVNYDTKKYTGFAFGMGVERIAMLRYGIDDMRLFFENDLRFLKQF